MENSDHSISLWLVPIVALGFASTQLSWALFNVAIPIFLEDNFGIKFTLIGFIMTWDNIIAFFVQPYIGSLSDKTVTRIGRRFPYIIPGIILGALFFFLIPQTLSFPLFVFLGVIVLFNLSMALYRSPSVSLMPDLVSQEKRSMGNGIVNFMGGVFSGASLFVAGSLLEAGKPEEAFLFVSAGMILSLFVLISVIREPKLTKEMVESEDNETVFGMLLEETKNMFRSEDKSLLFMLSAILSWFIAWNAIEAFYSIYVWKSFIPSVDRNEAAGQAASVLFIFPVVFVVFTLIGGYLGGKIGRIKTMKFGLTFMTLSILAASFVESDQFLFLDISWDTSFTIIFVFAGASWGLVNINSIVVVWFHARDNGIGTGLYYAFASAAAILGPTIAGPLMDIEVKLLFVLSIIFLVIALFFLFLVKTGEATDTPSYMTGEALSEVID